MKIYTKTGDTGTTVLFNGARVPKNSLRVSLYGTVDELNSVLLIALNFNPPQELASDIEKVCEELFTLGADFATPITDDLKKKIVGISESNVTDLENKIDKYYEVLPKVNTFISTCATQFAAFINNARTICRRAERLAISVDENEKLSEPSLKYLNRLSDYLFATMRYANYLADTQEKQVTFK